MQRSVGLSVLAGIFFIAAVVNLLGAVYLGTGFFAHLDPSLDLGWMPTGAMEEMRRTPLWYMVAAPFVLFPMKIGLLVAAGAAFLAQKRRGRLLANLYVATSVLESAATAAALGAGIRTLVGILFPVLFFLLVNKVFADDLTH